MSNPRSRLRVTLCVLIGLLCLSLPGLSQAQSEQQAVVLLTEEDAARLRLTEEQFEWQVEYHRGRCLSLMARATSLARASTSKAPPLPATVR